MPAKKAVPRPKTQAPKTPIILSRQALQAPQKKQAQVKRLVRACRRASRRLRPFQTVERIRARVCPDTVAAHYGDIKIGSMLRVLRRVAERTGLDPDADELVDVGCGVGRWLLAASRRVRYVAGIEYLPERADIARALVPAAAVFCADATEEWTPWLDGTTHVVCYDLMFSAEQRQAVLDRVLEHDRVRCVVLWSRTAVPGFEHVDTVPTRTPAGEAYDCYVWRKI